MNSDYPANPEWRLIKIDNWVCVYDLGIYYSLFGKFVTDASSEARKQCSQMNVYAVRITETMSVKVLNGQMQNMKKSCPVNLTFGVGHYATVFVRRKWTTQTDNIYVSSGMK